MNAYAIFVVGVMNKPNFSWKTLSSKIVYRDSRITVREDEIVRPDKTDGKYTVVESLGPSVFSLAITEKEEIYLIAQYRYTTGIYSWEVPSGSSNYKDLLIMAKRELQEEAGIRAKKWEKISTFQSMKGICNEISNVFIARDLIETKDNEKLKEGIYEVKKVSFRDAFKMIKQGEISDDQSIAAIIQAALWLGYNLTTI